MNWFERFLAITGAMGIVCYIIGKIIWRGEFTPFAPRTPQKKLPSYLLDDHDQSVVMTRELDDTRHGE